MACVVAAGCDRSTGPTTTPTTAPTKPKPAPAPRPATVPNPMVQLASHAHHTCGLRKTSDVLCWGKNTYGQLGDGRRNDSPRLVKVGGVADATAIAVGKDFSCALRRGGTVVCWGNNEDGQLGDGRGVRPGALSLRPVAVGGLRGVQQIVTGEYHACARQGSGQVACWGNAGNGQLGTDEARAIGMPRVIGQLKPVRHLSSGGSHVCALERSGVIKCWGRNTEGQLGDGKSGSRIKPVQVASLEDVVDVVSGSNHSCARTRSGAVACWGDNKAGQLGPGARGPKSNTPVTVPGLRGVVELAGGGRHNCARLDSGRVVCWGANEAGQLGHRSSATHRSQPTPVRNVGDAVALALGEAHSCAVRTTGTVACWGTQDYGALGPHRIARLEIDRERVLR